MKKLEKPFTKAIRALKKECIKLNAIYCSGKIDKKEFETQIKILLPDFQWREEFIGGHTGLRQKQILSIKTGICIWVGDSYYNDYLESYMSEE